MDERVINAIKNINIRLNHLNDYVVMLMQKLDESKIVNHKEFNESFEEFVSKTYDVSGTVEIKSYNLEV